MTIGTTWERTAMKELESAGWLVVRSAASKGPVDLVAWNADAVRLIQVKRCGGTDASYHSAKSAAKAQLRRIPAPANTLREIWIRRKAAWERILV